MSHTSNSAAPQPDPADAASKSISPAWPYGALTLAEARRHDLAHAARMDAYDCEQHAYDPSNAILATILAKIRGRLATGINDPESNAIELDIRAYGRQCVADSRVAKKAQSDARKARRELNDLFLISYWGERGREYLHEKREQSSGTSP